MKLRLICLLVFSVLNTSAQQQVPLNEKRHVDSLETLLRSARTDSSRAVASFMLVEYWKFKDTIKSKTFLMRGKQLAGSSPYLKALTYFYEGQYYFNCNTTQASAAFKTAQQKLAAFHTPQAYGKLAAAWYNYAIMNRGKGYEFITGITTQKTLPYAEKAGDQTMVAFYYSQLATILMNNYQFAKANFYNEKAIAVLEKKDPKSTNLLLAYLNGVSIGCYAVKTTAAKELLQKAKALLTPYPGSLNYTLYYYNEALYHTTIESYKEAIASADKGIVLATKYNQKQMLQQLLFRNYEAYVHLKAYAKARGILLGIAKEGTMLISANDKAMVYGELAKTNQLMGNYQEAYDWQNKHQQLTDSMHNKQLEVKINELETKYRSVESQKKIAELQAKNRQTELKSKNEKLFNWLLGSGCLSLLAILTAVLLNARSNRQLAAQKEINYRQQLIEMEQKQQLHIAKAMLDGEENERERVARDLHDGLGGMLAGVKIGLSGLSSTNNEFAQDKELFRIIGQLDTSVTELRRIARNLLPETLLKFGLEVAIKDLSEFHMRDGLHIDLQTLSIEKSITLNVQLNIYRIIQELLSNAIKHANAKNVLIQCSQNGSVFFITVEDDGIGFDTKILKGLKGMGLENLKNRVSYLRGRFELRSVINEGTTVNIELNTHEYA
ncbi:sensor histidine kinase [Mucilaginibacter achroorhodeus]|uniref:Sensor histidine kinase n=1 Tax=Mucilaginibacter achroorhodeus TaxID=2599294 RepID=A0A563U5X3_9SPHI|nr:sensor histidine kinase [Mucilaginibacter achroorhodeus]TWR26757.1 sensor histidine kinase [Mucilaginibacter achroorhodeus]